MSASLAEKSGGTVHHPMDVPVRAPRRIPRAAIAAALAIAVLLVAVALVRRESPAMAVDRSTVVIAKVERAPLIRETRGLGELVAEHSRIIATETRGRVEEIRVRAGQEAGQDTVVLVLSNPEAIEQAAEAKAQLALAEAELAGAQAAIAQQIFAIRAAAARLEGESAEAAAKVRSLRELAKAGLAPRAEVELAEVRATSASTRAALAQQELDAAEGGVRAQVAAKQARVEQARATYEARNRVVDALEVKALFSGIVQELLVEAGQHVEPGTNLARIADPAAMLARVRIPPSQARDVVAGLEARVDTHSGIVAGRVARVDPAVREGTVTVEIALNGALPSGIRPDSPVEATIVLGRVAETTLVRRPAGAQDGASIELFRVDAASGEGRRTQVKLGRGSTTAVEVLEGLRPGDEVVISDTTPWREYERIRIR